MLGLISNAHRNATPMISISVNYTIKIQYTICQIEFSMAKITLEFNTIYNKVF